jgi:hypothetical protein
MRVLVSMLRGFAWRSSYSNLGALHDLEELRWRPIRTVILKDKS